MGTPYRVMTVCTGNICRSPIAEAVLRDRFEAAGLDDRVVVASTGVSSEEHGNPIDDRAAAVLREHGYPVPAHVARQVRLTDVATSDLVLAMTSEHATALRVLARGAADAAARVRMYRSFDPAAPRATPGGHEHLLDIDDPWYGDAADFEDCLVQIESGADGIVAHVAAALAERDDKNG